MLWHADRCLRLLTKQRPCPRAPCSSSTAHFMLFWYHGTILGVEVMEAHVLGCCDMAQRLFVAPPLLFVVSPLLLAIYDDATTRRRRKTCA